MNYYPIEKLNKLAEEIVSLMPPLAEFFEEVDSIEPYSKRLVDYQTKEIYLRRQKYFLDLIRAKVDRLFNESEHNKIKILDNQKQGLQGGVVDHHGIINDPILFGVNIVSNYYRMFDRDKNGDILTFATGNVPLNNPFHRRGFMIDGKRVNLFAKEDKNKLVFRHPVYKFDFVTNLKKNHLWHEYTHSAQNFLEQAQEIISSIDYSNCHMLGDQFTKINFYLWPFLFDESIRKNVSNLVSLEYDDVVIDYLIRVIENEKESFIYQMLFDDGMRTKALGHFEGTQGAWDEQRRSGTHFFWGVDQNNEQARMHLSDGKLISEDNKIVISWNENSIVSALRNREILPNMLLKFSLIIFYMGLRPQAGYGSANYISIMKNNVINYLGEDHAETQRIKEMKVNNLTTAPVVLKRSQNGVDNYFAFDVMKDHGLTMDYFERINKIPLKYFLGPALNDIYDYAFHLYGKGERTKIKVVPGDYSELFQGVIG